MTSAGLPFALHADFELVASRQDVSDSHAANHVLLGRVPRLFVHAVLSDPALGEEAFATFLPDVDAVRRDHRSGGSRKWATLAAALHRETAAFMTIPTEDVPRRVRRRHAVLRPAHLSTALVPNALLVRVTAGDKHFAHADAVAEMGLESCVAVCPMTIVLDCIRVVLERAARPNGGSGGGGQGGGAAAEDGGGDDEGAAARRRGGKPSKQEARRGGGRCGSEGCGVLSDELLVEVWRYLAAEHLALRSQLDQPPLPSPLQLERGSHGRTRTPCCVCSLRRSLADRRRRRRRTRTSRLSPPPPTSKSDLRCRRCVSSRSSDRRCYVSTPSTGRLSASGWRRRS